MTYQDHPTRIDYVAYVMLLESATVQGHELAVSISRCYDVHDVNCVFGSDTEGVTLCERHDGELAAYLQPAVDTLDE